MLTRRGLISGLAALVAAPAIVRAQTLMPISGDTYRIWKWKCPLLPPIIDFHGDSAALDSHMRSYLGPNGGLYEGTWTFFGKTGNIYADQEIAFSKVEILRRAQ